MAFLDRQIMILRNRDDVELIIHLDFSDLYLLAYEIMYNANSSSGKEVIFLFGVDQELHIHGIKGSEKVIINQLNTFMGIFKPNINYKIQSRFSPSDNKIIYYLHINPILNRLFFPHKIRKDFMQILSQIKMSDFSSSLHHIIQETSANQVISINTMINFFSSIHIDQFSDFIDESVTQKINRIVDSIQYFEKKADLMKAIDVIGLKKLFGNNAALFALKCSTKILMHLDMYDDLSRQIVINRLQHLFKLLPEGIQEFEANVNYFLRDLIIEKENIFGYTIDSYDDLLYFMQIFSSVGITVHLDRTIKEIEYGDKIQKKIRIIKSKKKKIIDDDTLARIFTIFIPYFQEKESNVKSVFNEVEKHKLNKSRLLAEIQHRDRIIRPVNKLGRHDRDNRLALLVKEYYEFECQSCDSKKSKVTEITVSHNIPLYFGVEFGGVDKSCNMQVLCRFCHDAYEASFEKEIFENKDIISKSDLLEYLKGKYSCNFD